MYGERGRIGLITLATDTSVLPEYQRAMPAGVAVYPAPILLPRGEVTPAALAEMLAVDSLERAASLLTWAEVGTIGFACTSGSFVHGVGWDRVLVERIEGATGVPATTTATAVVQALRAVGARTVAVATPYTDDLNRIERGFLEGNGFAVAAIGGLGCGIDAEIGRLGPDDAVRLVAEVDRPEADAIFVSCTNWHCLEAVPELEARLGKPVVTSNLAGAWAALQAIGLDEAAPASGTLLDRYLGLGVAA
ncbi:MAG: maleate cis-trans isomerase [Chloroflexia bacterium]|nr:maleate cis-trans isomerase [Chloroflexia bacterium]